MYFDRFDIAEAWYLALSHCHGGQSSREYERLSKLTRHFKPSPMLSVESLSDNAREIYRAACNKLCPNSPVSIIHDLWVCVDCGMFIANGDLPEDEEASAAILAAMERDAPAEWVSGDREDECFSRSSCDCCGSTLGGARMSAALVTRNK